MPKILKIKRVAIGDKLRFEVFKRDKFMCQYCGQKAPDVVLNVDHIKPVADGGNNGLLNLVTSCRGCNSGKSDRLLDDASAVSTSRAQADTLQERRQQIQMLADWHIGLECCEPEIDAVNALLTKLANVSVSTDGCRANARKLIKQYEIGRAHV